MAAIKGRKLVAKTNGRRPVGAMTLLELNKSETKVRKPATGDKVYYGRVRGLLEGRRG